MKKTLITLTLAGALFTGYSVYESQKEKGLTDTALANVEALANGESSGVTHTLECNDTGLKMCEGTCNRCQVTIRSWGSGGTSKFTCSDN